MSPADFLRTVWPAEGIYCLAIPFRTPDGIQTYRHKTFDTIEAAAAAVESLKRQHNIFFNVHTLKEHRIWDPDKENKREGTKGAYAVRVHTNACAAKCFFFDLDVGPGDRKYPDQFSALADLIRFCREAQLPRPMVTSSGGGLHVYWLIGEPMASPEWKQVASKLRALAKHHGLKADPARTTDVSSVLRVAGTYNFKTGVGRPVEVLKHGSTTPTGEFGKSVHDAVIRAGITVKPAVMFPTQPDSSSDLASNLDDGDMMGPPVSMRALASACPQMVRQIQLQGNVSEPEWYHVLNLVRFVENGDKLVHKISEKHPDYDPDEVDRKVAQLRSKGIRPTSCAKLAEVAGDELCEGCVFAGRVKSPIVAARQLDYAAPPTIQTFVGATPVTVVVPPPPHPYKRLKAGGVSLTAKNKDGDEIPITIFPHDLYPIRRLVNAAAQQEQQLWRVVLPRLGDKDFVVDADALYDRKKFVACISNHGIYPSSANVPHLQDYMIAYIAELQKQADAELQSAHLGWIEKNTAFVLPDKILLPDGTARPATLTVGAQRASKHIRKEGTLQRQVELLRFYNRPGYVDRQYLIGASLGAMLFHATGHHGVVVNAVGKGGTGKSTALYAAASLWGHPDMLPINGTSRGATANFKAERISTWANLPICVDEITEMSHEEARGMTLNVTQPGHRGRLEHQGIERETSDAYKATMMLCTANASLHGLLSYGNIAGTAGSMRVFEMHYEKCAIHTKAEADDFLWELKQNYGHIGEVFVAHVVANQEAVNKRVRELMKLIDQQGSIDSAERFWSACAASTVAALEIARDLGLLAFNPATILHWVLKVQIPFMRGVVNDEYASPVTILTDYLETISGNTIITIRNPSAGNLAGVSTNFATRQPHGAMLAHYDTHERVMYVLKKGFKDYCMRIGANSTNLLNELFAPKIGPSGQTLRVVKNKQIRRTLGAGTEFAKTQSWCFAIDMTHPEMTGSAIHGTLNNPTAPKTAPGGNLKVVK